MQHSLTTDSVRHLFKLGNYYGKESLHEEFKEFCLKSIGNFFKNTNLSYVGKQDFDHFDFDKVTFNKIVAFDVDYYINHYLARYIGNFSAAGVDGILHIGISDSGIIEGIPYFGNLDIDVKTIMNAILKNIRTNKAITHDVDDDHLIEWYRQNIKIDIKKLEIDITLFAHDAQIFSKLQHAINKHALLENQWKEYKKLYDNWNEMMLKYNISLKNLMNNKQVRFEIIDFINNYKCKNKSVENFDKIIDFFKSEIICETDITYDDILEMKHSYQHYLTWVILFKDEMILKYMSQKPTPPTRRLHDNTIYKLTQQISCIRNYLIKCDCCFYTISFIIPKYYKHCVVEYLDEHQKWKCKKRVLSGDEPVTTLCFA